MIIALFVLLSFGLTVKLIGLLGLAYTKKEGLGKVYKITSYLTIACGTLVIVGGIVGAIVMSTCHSHCHGGKNKCHMQMQSSCGGGSCESSDNGSSCKKSSCEGESSCEGREMKIIKKKIIKDVEDGENINVEVEIIED